MDEHTKHFIDWTSMGIAISSIMSWVPPITALLSLIWLVGRLYEMFTGKLVHETIKEYWSKV